MPPQRLPIVNSDDGTWGDILRQYLLKEHYDDGTNNAANGGHKTITIRAGTASANTAPLKFTSGTLLTTPEAGAIEFNTDTLYFTQTTGPTRRQIVTDGATQTLTNKTLSSPTISGTASFPQNTALELYNTSDQVTNYEKTVVRYSSNILEVGHIYGGTGVTRTARFGTSGAANNLNRYIQVQGSTPFISYQWSGTVLTGHAINIGSGNSFLASSGSQVALGIDPIINQSGTASYTGLLINPAETSTGSGSKLLIDAQVGGASKFKVDNTGGITFGTDTNLYRSAANTLKTDDNLIVGTPGTVSGSAVTIDGNQTLTNKTLTSPIITNPQIPTSIYDSNWNQVIDLVGIGSAVNHYYITNQSAGNYPTIGVDGSDSNIGIALAPKGTGPVRIYVSSGQTPVIDAAGPDTNLNINLVPKGTGTVQQNGVSVATVSGGQTLTNKSINLSSNTLSGTTAQFNAALSDGNFAVIDGNNNFSADTFIKGATWTVASGGTTVLTIDSTQVQAFSGSASQTVRLPTTSVKSGQSYTIVNATSGGTITVQSSNSDVICTIPFNGAGVFTAGPDAPVDEGNWVGNVTGAGAVFSVTNTMTFSGNDGTFMTFPSSSDDIVGEVATQTLTNKTLTSPRVVSDIFDANGSKILGLSPSADATRWIYITNADDGWHPFINAEGNGANIDLGFAPKGTGRLYSYQPSGSTTTFLVDGTASNIDFDIVAKGTGVVKANGVDVATVSNTQTLSNKRIQPRLASTVSSATPSINTNTVDTYQITALATNITSMTTNLTGTPSIGEQLLISIKDDGSPRTISWGASYISSGVATLPTTTVSGKTHWIGLVWDGSKWACLAADAVGY